MYAIFLFLVSQAYSGSCPRVECNREQAKFKCLNTVEDAGQLVIYERGCGYSDEFCEVEQLKEAGFSAGYCMKYNYNSDQPKGVEYDDCKNDSDCYSSLCTNEQCVGVQEGSTCIESRQCASNLFCNAGKCESRISPEDTKLNCTEHEHCVNWAGCLESKCIDLYSVDSGSRPRRNITGVTEEIKDSYHIFCKSDYIMTESAVCEDLEPIEDVTCTYDHTTDNYCNYRTSITTNIEKRANNCNCSLDADDLAKCHLSTRSSEWLSYINERIANMKLGCPYWNKENCRLISQSNRQDVEKAYLKFKQIEYSDYDCILKNK